MSAKCAMTLSNHVQSDSFGMEREDYYSVKMKTYSPLGGNIAVYLTLLAIVSQ